MNDFQMKLLTDKSIKKITKNEAIFEDGSSLSCDLAIIIPPYIAPKVILEANLGDDKGFVPTDSDMRHLEYRDIYAAGDITSLAQPKLGHISIIQAGVAANTFLKDIGEVDAKPPKDLSVFCIMNMGGVEATLINDNTLFGGSTSIAFHSPISRMMKWAFDNELYYTKGHMPPIWAMKMANKIIGMV
jgi:sulfide:quinone oxidoreductase